jgi:PmbA protein
MSDLMPLAEAAVEAARHAGAEWVDATCANYHDISVGVEKSSLRDCETSRELGLGVRAFVRGGRGIASVLHPTPASAAEAGRQAAEMARATHGDPAFVALPGPQPVPEVAGLFDPAVAGLSAEQSVRWCREALEEARAVSDEAVLSGGVDFTWGEKVMASSTGIRVATASTSLALSFSAVIRHGDQVGLYHEFDFARRLEDFEPRGVAALATKTALSFLGARSLPTAQMPVIFGPLAADAFLYRLVAAANAESVQRRRSFLAGKLGEPVASELLTLLEDPFVPAGISSAGADGEGVPKQKRALIERGVLTTYLHNSYTAGKAGVPDTGHAARSGYGADVGIGTSNLFTQTGDKTLAELIAEVDEGLYICDAAMSTDSITGDVSATVDFGFKIEHGELVYPVEATMIGGNLLDLTGRIDAISSDYREEPGRRLPSVRLSRVQVSGGG